MKSHFPVTNTDNNGVFITMEMDLTENQYIILLLPTMFYSVPYVHLSVANGHVTLQLQHWHNKLYYKWYIKNILSRLLAIIPTHISSEIFSGVSGWDESGISIEYPENFEFE